MFISWYITVGDKKNIKKIYKGLPWLLVIAKLLYLTFRALHELIENLLLDSLPRTPPHVPVPLLFLPAHSSGPALLRLIALPSI